MRPAGHYVVPLSRLDGKKRRRTPSSQPDGEPHWRDDSPNAVRRPVLLRGALLGKCSPFWYLDAEQDRDSDDDAECADGVASDRLEDPAVQEALDCTAPGSRRAIRLLGVDPRATIYDSAAGVAGGW